MIKKNSKKAQIANIKNGKTNDIVIDPSEIKKKQKRIL